MGRVKGEADLRTPGVQRSIVILAFGAPEKIIQPDGSEELGTVLPFTDVYASLDAIKDVVQRFAIGYTDGVDGDGVGDDNSFITIIAGTSNLDPNDEGFVTDEHGRQWANMVEDLQDWLETHNLNEQIEVTGGSDMELVWSRPSTTIAWVNGYRQVTQERSGRFLYNFGDAAGCPPVGGDPAGGNCEPGGDNVPWEVDWVWTSEQVWYISRGVGNTFPIPQIYNRDPDDNPGISSNAEQWTLLKLDAANNNRTPTLLVLGTLTQRQRCDDLAATGDDACAQAGTDNTSRQGWLEMYNELNDFPETEQSVIPYRTDIREPRTGRDF
ncbi:MAG: hypothetical protein HC876_16685 [Chloroflexaceae bacterium]|nr:hypothetical protein [Chloroflexaceae bacterium]